MPFIQSRVSKFDGHTLTTDKGPITARHFIDATGWRAALAAAVEPGFVDRGRLTIGMEVTVPHRTDAMHFYVNREIVRWGYGWIFPCGDESRVGLGAFDNQKGLPDLLRAFLRRLDMPDDLRTMERTGGFLPWQQRPAVRGNLWLLGDAAGHCLPLTGEGIRFAFQDGDVAGRLTQRCPRGYNFLGRGERIVCRGRGATSRAGWLVHAPPELCAACAERGFRAISMDDCPARCALMGTDPVYGVGTCPRRAAAVNSAEASPPVANRVTVIIPTYNGVRYLVPCLMALRRQTFTRLCRHRCG